MPYSFSRPWSRAFLFYFFHSCTRYIFLTPWGITVLNFAARVWLLPCKNSFFSISHKCIFWTGPPFSSNRFNTSVSVRSFSEVSKSLHYTYRFYLTYPVAKVSDFHLAILLRRYRLFWGVGGGRGDEPRFLIFHEFFWQFLWSSFNELRLGIRIRPRRLAI